MAQEFSGKEATNSTLAFFFLVLYTASVFIRPHEMFLVSIEWLTIRTFAIICLLAIILTQRPLKLYPQHWMLLALMPFIVMSSFLNGSGVYGLEYSWQFFVGSIIPLFLFTSCLTTMKRQHILMVVCLIAALLMVHNGHVQQSAYLGFGWAFDTRSVGYINLGERRITYLGFFNDPNDLGMFLVMNIPFAIYFHSQGNFLKKIIMLTILAALGYGIYLTDSRGTMLGAGALLAVYFLVVNAGTKLFLAAVVLAPIAATVLMSLQSNIDSSAEGRLEAWYAGILMLLHNPIFGVGRGQFLEEHGLVAHNSYIHVAAELGVPGYSLWGGALVFTVLTGYLFIKARKKQIDPETKEVIEFNAISQECQDELKLNKAIFFSLMGFMITSFFISRMFTLLVFVFIGMALASHVRVIKLMPEFQQHFTNTIAKKSMVYCWAIIIAVYISLKLGL